MLECNSCGSRPRQWDLLRPDSKAGDQCPCCFLDDYDCDGTLVEVLDVSPPDYGGTAECADTVVLRRASGDAKCEVCGKSYKEHGMSHAQKGFNGEPYLNVLCDGTLVKL